MSLTKNQITAANVKWGICGFASTLVALHTTTPLIQNVKADDFKIRLLAEIKTFLKMLEADEDPLLGEIEKLTKTFAGYEKFTTENFIAEINKLAVAPGKPVNVPEKLGIAMPPEAVVKYLEKAWNKKAKFQKGDAKGKNGVIVGLFDGKKNLKHWIFKEDDDNVFNYGEVTTLAAAVARVKDRVVGGYIEIK